EADAAYLIARNLGKRFAGVTTQCSIKSQLRCRVDIAIGDGKIGVEVKLGRALAVSTSEAFRAIGQAVAYKELGLEGNLVVAIVGHAELLRLPVVAEAMTLLQTVTPVVVFVRMA